MEDNSWLELSKQREEMVSAIFLEAHSRTISGMKRIENGMNSTRIYLNERYKTLLERESDVASAEMRLIARASKLVEIENKATASVESKRLELAKETERLEELKVLTRGEESKLERFRAMVSKSFSELERLERSVAERSVEAESKARELELCQKQVRDVEAVLELKEKNAIEIQKKFEASGEEVARREARIAELDREIGSREKRLATKLSEFKKKRDLMSDSRQATENLLEGCSLEIKAKQKRVENVSSEIEKLDSKLEEISASALTSAAEKLGELESQGKSFASLETELKKKIAAFELRKVVIKIESESTPLASQPCPANRASYDASLEYVNKLIQRGDIILAVGVILELKLSEEFSPVDLLNKYMEDTKNDTKTICTDEHQSQELKIMAMNKELAIMRATMDFTKEHGLAISIEMLENRIGFLEGSMASYKMNDPKNVPNKATRVSKRQRFFSEGTKNTN